MSTLYADPTMRWQKSKNEPSDVLSLLGDSAENLAKKLSPHYARIHKFMGDTVSTATSLPASINFRNKVKISNEKTPVKKNRLALLSNHMNDIKASVRAGIVNAFRKENKIAPQTATFIFPTKTNPRQDLKAFRKALAKNFVPNTTMTKAKLSAMKAYCGSYEAFMADSAKEHRRAGFRALTKTEIAINNGSYNSAPVIKKPTWNFNFTKISKGLRDIKVAAELATSHLLIGLSITMQETKDKLARVSKFMSGKVSNISFGDFASNDKKMGRLALVVCALAFTVGIYNGLTPAEALTTSNVVISNPASNQDVVISNDARKEARSDKIKSAADYRNFVNGELNTYTENMKSIGGQIAKKTDFQTFADASINTPENPIVETTVEQSTVRIGDIGDAMPHVNTTFIVPTPDATIVPTPSTTPHISKPSHVVHSSHHVAPTGVSVAEDHELRMMGIRRNEAVMSSLGIGAYQAAQNVQVRYSYDLSDKITPASLIDGETHRAISSPSKNVVNYNTP